MFAVFKATQDVTAVLPVNCSMLTYLQARINFSANRTRPSLSGKYSNDKTEAVVGDVT